MTKTKAESATTIEHAWWVLRGNWLPNGARIAGPFSTREDALTARSAVERFAGGETFWIDSEPTPSPV